MYNDGLFYISVKAIIKHEDQYLLLHRSNWGKKNVDWSLPGGRLSLNEMPLEALVREIYEETRLTRDYYEKLTFLMPFYTNRIVENKGILYMLYTANLKQGVNIILSQEHDYYEFWSKDKLLDFLNSETYVWQYKLLQSTLL